MKGWFKKEDPKEVAKKAKREARREVRSNQRDLDREIRELDREEKKVTAELKQRAKVTNNPKDPTLNTLAKQLVNVRAQRSKLHGAKAQVGAMGMHATVTASQMAAVSAIGSVTQTMKVANDQVKMSDMTKIMAEFTRENEKAQMKEEMMDDVLADAFDAEGLEEEADEVTNQVLAELGVEMDGQMVGLNAPTGKLAATANQEEEAALDDALPDLKARLDAL